MARILVVEDEIVLRLTFREFLVEEGYETVVADDYSDAVAQLEKTSFDVVVTDIILPGKNGIELLRTVKSHDPDCPVIMITGEPDVSTASQAVRLGAFDYLSKPVDRTALLRVARLACAHRQLALERNNFASCMDMYRRELEAIFNSVIEGIITVDAEMRLRQANTAAAAILSLPVPELNGRVLDEVLPARMEPALRALEQTLRTGRPSGDCRIVLELGKQGERIVIVSTTPLTGEQMAFPGALLTIRDVTQLTRLEEQLEDTQHYHDMVGKSIKMREIFALLKELAETDSTALICGESGTGKELVAAALHYSGPRAKGPFIKVNCAALSEDILESELFGHVKGAFTGAVKDRVGRFEAAHGGTILLDEIGDICPRLQLRLLRVLQDREFERVGDSKPIRSDVRVIASTNQDLVAKIRSGEFRQDLYYRLNVVRIDIPPLRDRREDIPLLADHFCRRFARQFRKDIRGVAPETLDLFMQYPWPGNIRELENCIERAFIVCREPYILPNHLPREFLMFEPLAGTSSKPPVQSRTTRTSDFERVLAALERTDWNIAKSARILGIARNTLYQRMRTLNVTRPTE